MKAPKTVPELFQRAVTLHRSGQANEAEPLYRKVISRNAQHDPALFGLSVVLLERGQLEESRQYLERAVQAAPDEPNYVTNLGEIYRRQGHLERAARAFEHVLAIDPDHADARQNLAVTLIMVGANDQALPHLEQVIELRPDEPVSYVSLAWVLLQLERPREAAARARRAIELAPTLATAHRYLGTALDDLGDRTGAIASYRRCVELSPKDHNAHSTLIVAMLTEPSYDARAVFTETRVWAARHAEPLRKFQRLHTNDKRPERPLRIGYVSPDFRAHPLQQFLVPLFQHHDPSNVELYLYSSVERTDAETEWYRAFAGAKFREIQRMDDVQVAELVRQDRIDILIDLALHSSSPRLRVFACKPAPIQITWLGYPGTTGLDAMDYRLTDPYCDPPGADLNVYAERSIHLPGCFWCYDALQANLPEGPLPALTNGFITFGCQNNPRKLNPGVLSLWARVLREVRNSHLFLYLEPPARAAVLEALASAGVPADRIEFGGRVSRREYLERYQRIDIALDTFPYAGATTSLDALWMGVPVITLAGGPTLQRAGVSIAMNVGVSELVADSEDDFVQRALGLARDLERLARLRAELRARLEASPAGDTARFARDLEHVYRDTWRRYCGQT